MKYLPIVLAMLVVVIATSVQSRRGSSQRFKPSIPRPPPIPPLRLRRDTEQLSVNSLIVHGKPVSTTADIQKKIYENDHGNVLLSGGLEHAPHQKLGKNIGVSGRFDFGGAGRHMSQDERLLNAIMEQRRRDKVL